MLAIDYEVEYDNRARVPEHPEIFARWQRDGAAYRAAAHNPKLAMAYGHSLRQTIDLFQPRTTTRRRSRMFIHGGWWRSLEPVDVYPAGGGPNARGISVAVSRATISARMSRSPTSSSR